MNENNPEIKNHLLIALQETEKALCLIAKLEPGHSINTLSIVRSKAALKTVLNTNFDRCAVDY